MNLIKKLSVAGVSAAIALSAYAPAVFADGGVTCTITGNGAFSRNKCKVKVVEKGPIVIQGNYASIGTVATIVSATGGNTSNGNTIGAGGGGVSTTTSASTVTVTITNGPINTNINGPVTP